MLNLRLEAVNRIHLLLGLTSATHLPLLKALLFFFVTLKHQQCSQHNKA